MEYISLMMHQHFQLAPIFLCFHLKDFLPLHFRYTVRRSTNFRIYIHMWKLDFLGNRSGSYFVVQRQSLTKLFMLDHPRSACIQGPYKRKWVLKLSVFESLPAHFNVSICTKGSKKWLLWWGFALQLRVSRPYLFKELPLRKSWTLFLR